MTSVFRMATTQAVKDILEEHGSSGRFGLIVTPDGMETIANKLVDLFEMTLELRAKTSNRLEERNVHENPASSYNLKAQKEDKKNYHEFKLPRQKFELSLSEKEQFIQR